MKILFVTSGAYIPEFTGGIESTIHDMSVLLQQRGLSPGVDYRVWYDVGHYVQMERAGELRAAVEAFVQEHGLLDG